MKLSKNSWHHWLYEHTYQNRVPKNLCPYFWGLVAACVMFIPLTIWYGIYMVCFLIADKKDFEYPTYLEETFGIALVFNIMGGLVFCMTDMFWRLHTKHSEDVIFILGGVGWGILVIIGIVLLVNYIGNRKSNKPTKYNPPKEREPSILAEFIKAKYNKMCPFIEWKD